MRKMRTLEELNAELARDGLPTLQIDESVPNGQCRAGVKATLFAITHVTQLAISLWKIEARSVGPTSFRKGRALGIPGLPEFQGLEPVFDSVAFETDSVVLANAVYLARDTEGRWFLAKADEDGKPWIVAPSYETRACF